MKQISRFLGLATLTAALFVPVAHNVAVAAEEPQRGGVLRTVVTPEPTMLTNAFHTGQGETVVGPKIFDGLFRYDFDFNLQPALALSADLSDDGKMLTIKLREGVQWHDGKPFTSADVLFTATEVWAKLHPRLRAVLAALDKVEAPDDYTVVFHFNSPSPAFNVEMMAYEAQVLPRHIYEGTDIHANPARAEPIGTGPFKFVEWQKGEYIVLERNDNYWDEGKPYLDRIVFRIIPDAASRVAALEAGELDIAGYNPVPFSDVARLQSQPELEVETRGYEHASDVLWLAYNLERPELANLKVRQAIAHAIDRDALARNVWYGLATPATGPVPKAASRFYTQEGVPQYEYNVEKAKQLLDEAGYPEKDGERFRLNLDWINLVDANLRTAEFIRQSLRQVGINATVRNQDVPGYLKRIYTDYDYDLNVFYASGTSDPTIGVQRFFHSAAIQKGTPFTNATGYRSEEMDRILDAARNEHDVAKRVELFGDFQRLAQTDLPTLPLAWLDAVTISNKRVRNHTTGPEGFRSSFADVWLAPED